MGGCCRRSPGRRRIARSCSWRPTKATTSCGDILCVACARASRRAAGGAGCGAARARSGRRVGVAEPRAEGGRGSCSESSSVPRAERMPGRVEHHPAFSCGWCAPGDAPGPGASPSSPADPQARRPARRPDRVRELTDRSRLLVQVDQVVREVNGFLRLGRVLPLRQLGPAIRQDQHLRSRLARVGRVLIALDGDRSCHQGIVKAYELRQGGGNRWRSIELQARCQRPSGSRARRRAHALISPLSATIGGS